MPESSNKGGRKPRVTDDDLLGVFRATSDPVLSTAEVADAVPIKRRGTLNRLRDLEDAGALDSKQIGGRNTVWWTVDERTDTAGESPSIDPSPVDDRSGGGETSTDTDWFPDLNDVLPGSGANLEGRIQAAKGIHEYLKNNGSGKRSDFKQVVDVEATGYKDFNSFYTNCMDNGAVLAQLPGVQAPGEGGHTYTYGP